MFIVYRLLYGCGSHYILSLLTENGCYYEEGYTIIFYIIGWKLVYLNLITLICIAIDNWVGVEEKRYCKNIENIHEKNNP